MAKAKYKSNKHLSTYLAAGVIGLAGATLLGTQQAQAAQTAKVTYQNGATTVWNHPNVGQQPTRYLTKGQTVKVQATKQVYGEQWYQIANDEWVPAKYFQAANATAAKTAPAKTADTVTGNYKAGAITVWTSPTSGVATGQYMVYGQTKSTTNKKQVGNITWYQIGDNAWVPSVYVAYNDPQLTQTAPASAASLNTVSTAGATQSANAASAAQAKAEQQKAAQSAAQASQAAAQSAATQSANAASAAQAKAEQQTAAQSAAEASQAAAQSAATQSANAASAAQAKAEQQKAAQSTAQASQAAAQSAATQSANAASAAQAKAEQQKAAQASQAAAQSAATQSANAASAAQAKQQQASQASAQAASTQTQQSSSTQTQAASNNNNTAQKSNSTNYGTGAQAAISAAQSQIGVAYSWGGETPGVGFDCSGLTQWALSKAGVSIPRVTTAQESAGQRISISQLQPGDLVFWGSAGATYHVALYIGNNQYIHAPQPGQSVTIASISNYFKPSFGVRVF